LRAISLLQLLLFLDRGHQSHKILPHYQLPTQVNHRCPYPRIQQFEALFPTKTSVHQIQMMAREMQMMSQKARVIRIRT
jgi:hypothetical protein